MDMNTETYYSDIEVEDCLNNLGKADIARVLQVYRTLGSHARSGMSEHDVLNQVLLKTLSLERRWPRDVKPIIFLIETGRSIVSNEEKKYSTLTTTPTFDELLTTGEISKPTSTVSKLSNPAAEAYIEQTQSDSVISEWINKIHELFEDDQEVICFIKGKLAEYKKAKILVFCNFSDQVYRNIEKRIKDKVRKRFPNGLPWWEVES